MSHLQEAERDENDADEKLQQLKKQKDGADGKRKAELEEEEKRLSNLRRGIFPVFTTFPKHTTLLPSVSAVQTPIPSCLVINIC